MSGRVIRRRDGRSAGLISPGGVGPWLYFDNGTLMAHAYARYFWTSHWSLGEFRWNLTLMWGDRVVLSRGRG